MARGGAVANSKMTCLALLIESVRNHRLMLQTGLSCLSTMSCAWPWNVCRGILNHIYAYGPSWFITEAVCPGESLFYHVEVRIA